MLITAIHNRYDVDGQHKSCGGPRLREDETKTRKGSMLGTWGAAPLFAQFLNGSNAFEGGAIWRRLAEAKTPEALMSTTLKRDAAARIITALAVVEQKSRRLLQK